MNKEIPFHLVILGPQGSGKGTQMRFLAERFKMPSISAGELIRKKMAENSKESRMIKKINDQGGLISNLLTKKLIKGAASNIPLTQVIIFEGYPRTKEQYGHFLAILKHRKIKAKMAILLNISDKTVYKRIGGRRYCIVCEKNYYPPESLRLKKCTSCGGKLARRSDDYKKAILNRLSIFKKETNEIIKFFRKNNELIEVDGEPSIERVSKEIEEKIKTAVSKFSR